MTSSLDELLGCHFGWQREEGTVDAGHLSATDPDISFSVRFVDEFHQAKGLADLWASKSLAVLRRLTAKTTESHCENQIISTSTVLFLL